MTRHTRDVDQRNDRGSVLILTLLVVVVLGSTVVALATYATTSLRASTNARSANERRFAADGALKVAIDGSEPAPPAAYSTPRLPICPTSCR